MADKYVCRVWSSPKVELWVDTGNECYILKRYFGGKGTKSRPSYFTSLEVALRELLKVAHISRLAEDGAQDIREAIEVYHTVAREIGLIGEKARELVASVESAASTSND